MTGTELRLTLGIMTIELMDVSRRDIVRCGGASMVCGGLMSGCNSCMIRRELLTDSCDWEVYQEPIHILMPSDWIGMWATQYKREHTGVAVLD